MKVVVGPNYQVPFAAEVRRTSLTHGHDEDVYQAVRAGDTVYVAAVDREGNAASLTRQKNADSVQNVIAMDALEIGRAHV